MDEVDKRIAERLGFTVEDTIIHGNQMHRFATQPEIKMWAALREKEAEGERLCGTSTAANIAWNPPDKAKIIWDESKSLLKKLQPMFTQMSPVPSNEIFREIIAVLARVQKTEDTESKRQRQLAENVVKTRTAWLEQHGVPISPEFATFAEAVGLLVESILPPHVCHNPNHALVDGSPFPHEIGLSCAAALPAPPRTEEGLGDWIEKHCVAQATGEIKCDVGHATKEKP